MNTRRQGGQEGRRHPSQHQKYAVCLHVSDARKHGSNALGKPWRGHLSREDPGPLPSLLTSPEPPHPPGRTGERLRFRPQQTKTEVRPRPPPRQSILGP